MVHKYTDKKENKIFLVYKEIKRDQGAKSYMTNGLTSYIGKNFRISSCIRKSYLIFFCTRSHLNFLIYEENFVFFFYQCTDERNGLCTCTLEHRPPWGGEPRLDYTAPWMIYAAPFWATLHSTDVINPSLYNDVFINVILESLRVRK